MSALKVKMAGRFLNRQAGRVAKSVYKSLGELITNSDDSYSRLVAAGKLDPDALRVILVVWDQRRKEFRVIDHAEGMTDTDMEEKFAEYGKDTSGSSEGAPVRGLFGQGISDVLFFHQKGHVLSIVDRTLYRCPFVSDGAEWTVDPKRTHTKVDQRLRESLRIPEGNGTVVSFQLAPGVKKEVRHFIPKMERLPALRLINSHPNKLVRYIEIRAKGVERTHDLHYEFPEGELLAREEVSFEYEDFPPVTARVELRRSADPLDDDEAGLLVYDEREAVYDFTLFGLSDPSQTLFGTVQLAGARDIIIAKMNQDEPEEILSDDRSGFVPKHPFYLALQKAIRAVVEPHIPSPERESEPGALSDTQRTNQRKAIDIFNELYRNIIEDITPVTKPGADPTPPKNGMEFDRRAITATEGKTYRLGLNINAAMIPVGSVVTLSCDGAGIEVKPESFEVTNDMTQDGLARCLITVRGAVAGESGLVIAKYDDYVATTVATIISEIVVYPETLIFDPAVTTVMPDGSGRGFLYVNTAAIPPGSELRFEVRNATTEVALETYTHQLSSEDVAYDDVARLRFDFVVGGEGTAQIRVNGNEHEATLVVHVVRRKPNEPEAPQGKFADWQFGEISRRFQCYYDPDPKSRTYGMLVVSRRHPLNQLYFGSSPTKESISKSMTASTYLAELLLNAALDFMLSEAWRQEIDSGGSIIAQQDPHLYIQRYLATEKEKIGPEFHRLFIGEELMRKYQDEIAETSAVEAE